MAGRISILVIDDEKDLAFFIKQNLEFLGGCRVITCDNARKGLWFAVWRRPDLILLDIMMPGMDGFEVLTRLKHNKRTINIPVIMLTARGDEGSKLKACELYNQDYIVKPFEVKNLQERIKRAMQIPKY
jgi:DNA-binding response OmpR family regulator